MMRLRTNNSALIEINDPVVGAEALAHRMCRYAIRAGILSGLVDFPLFFRALSGLSLFASSNVASLVRKNHFFFRYLSCVRRNDFDEAIAEKCRWARFILNDPHHEPENAREVARQYLQFIESEQNGQAGGVSLKTNLTEFSGSQSYYVYGPNSDSLPRNDLQDATLVLTKFPNFDVSAFPRKVIFLNNYVLQNMDRSLLREHIKDYISVFIPAGHEPFEDNVNCMELIPSDNLASPMGLGRLIITLRRISIDASFYFEGFDLGLSKAAYSGKIMTALNLQDESAFERQYCRSLAIHDFAYNFMLVKNCLNRATVFGDNGLANILNMTLQEYLTNLQNTRNFSVI